MKKQAVNPYLPGYEYIPDGEPYVFGDRVYVYGSHDKFNGEVFCMNDYVCWSAPVDALWDWRYEGVIYKKMQDPRNPEGKMYMYAPDIVPGKDGRYYLYYTLEMLGVMSVAVGESPVGPFSYYGNVHYPDGRIVGEEAGDVYQFDPGVLMDDDGKVYLYTGFGPDIDRPEGSFIKGRCCAGCYCMELEPDMMTVKTDPVCVIPQIAHEKGTGFEDHAFFEASSIRKINGIYYLVYSSFQSHELCYAVSRFPDKDFVYGGTIISNGDIGLGSWTMEHPDNYIGNNHGGMAKINGQWYIFYHRQTNRHSYSRQGCAEPVFFDEKGHISQVEMTSCGLNGGPLKGEGRYSAAIACSLMSKEGAGHVALINDYSIHPCFTQTGIDREEQDDQYIANMRDGAVAGFKYFDLRETGEIRLELTGDGEGKMLISTSLNGDPIAEVPVDTEKKELTAVMKIPAEDRMISEKNSAADGGISIGGSALFFRFEGNGSVDFHGFELRKRK